MSYTPSYNRPPKGNFNKDKAFSQVRAGTDAYLLEDEANEMQAILSEQAREVMSSVLKQGVTQEILYEVDPTRDYTLKLPPLEVIFDGHKLKVAGYNNTGTPRTEADGEDILIKLPPKPSVDTRWDYIVLEVYEEEIRDGEVLYKYGTQGSDFVLDNDLLDPRVNAETSRRMQLKSKIHVTEGNFSEWLNQLPGAPYQEISLPETGYTISYFQNATGRYVFLLYANMRQVDELDFTTNLWANYPVAHLKPEVIPTAFIKRNMIGSGEVTREELAGNAVDSYRLADAAVTTIKLADGTVTNAKLGASAVSSTKIGTAAVTTTKIADGNVTFDKLAPEALKSLYYSQGFAVPNDQSGQNGMFPILRFFRWWSTPGSTTTLKPVDDWDVAQGHSAKQWGAEVLNNTINATTNPAIFEPWDYFEGIKYMNQYRGRWFDKNLQLTMYGSGNLADNVSILCVHNTSVNAETFNPGYFYSSYGGQNTQAVPTVAYKVFDPATPAVLDTIRPEDFTEIQVQATPATSHGANGSVTGLVVPAGHAVILVLKTSPSLATTSFYNNYHGFYNFGSTYMTPVFKPHMPTYRRLLTGKWW